MKSVARCFFLANGNKPLSTEEKGLLYLSGMDRNSIIKQYTNGEVTVVWKPGICQHSTICWKEATGLPGVFNPRIKPWVNMEGAPTERIVEQVKKCPSGALSYFYNKKDQ